MTKAKATKILLENCKPDDYETTISDTLARKIAQAFGYTLSDLRLRRFRLASYHLEDCVGRKNETHGIFITDLLKRLNDKKAI